MSIDCNLLTLPQREQSCRCSLVFDRDHRYHSQTSASMATHLEHYPWPPFMTVLLTQLTKTHTALWRILILYSLELTLVEHDCISIYIFAKQWLPFSFTVSRARFQEKSEPELNLYKLQVQSTGLPTRHTGCFFPFHTILCKPLKWLCMKIPVTEQIVKYCTNNHATLKIA